jgi:NADH-quinone oxidoreductase subunit N
MLIMLAVLSMVIGNVTAIAQTNIKRMLAYSAIAQMGFVLLGMLSVFDDHAYSAALFYAVTYTLTTLASFGFLMLLSKKVMMFSLAGIPPTVGFAAKLSVLEALVDAEYTALAIIAVMASLVGAFYYLRVVKVMYFDAPMREHEITGSGISRGILGINSIAILVLGIFPGALMALCLDVMRNTLLGG